MTDPQFPRWTPPDAPPIPVYSPPADPGYPPLAAPAFDAFAPPSPSRVWPPQPPPVRPRRRPFFWLGVLVALAALVGGSVLAVTSYTSVQSPGAVVKAYFADLAHRDAAGALAYGTVPAGDRSLLTKAVVSAQRDAGPIRSVRIAQVQQGATDAQVDVTYSLGDLVVKDELGLVKQHGKWALTATAVPVAVTVEAAENLALLAGRRVTGATYLMFPGALPMTFSAASLGVAPEDLAVRFASPGHVGVGVTVTPAAKAAIAAGVRAALGACLAGKSKDPLCPVPGQAGRSVPNSLKGVEVGLPHIVDVHPDDDNGTISVQATATVKGSYQQLDFENQPVTKSGNQSLTLSAIAPAATPGRIIWATF